MHKKQMQAKKGKMRSYSIIRHVCCSTGSGKSWPVLCRVPHPTALSCLSMDHSSSSSSGTPSMSSSEAAYSSQMMDGYDNEFVPHPESRYECPICLLVLREPRQTRCGHRFCRDCIIKSLRYASFACCSSLMHLNLSRQSHSGSSLMHLNFSS